MQSGLTTLLEGVIDYAGLFPPAKLDIPSAVEEYLDLRRGDDSWIVSRFAVPAGRLADLGAELEKHELEEVLPLTVIGTSSSDRHHWKAALDHDVAGMKAFADRFGDRGYIESYEVRIPHNSMVDEAIRLLDAVQIGDLFLELPWEDGLDEAVAALAGCEHVFAKARTGGADKSAFPTNEQLAFFLQHCVQLDLPFKLTAGLHHPLPVLDPVTGGRMHGFLNVLGAVALAYQEDLTVGEIARILALEDPSAFRFSGEGMICNGIEIESDVLAECRELFLCFGSCSVSEPLGDLESAGYGVRAGV